MVPIRFELGTKYRSGWNPAGCLNYPAVMKRKNGLVMVSPDFHFASARLIETLEPCWKAISELAEKAASPMKEHAR